MSAPAPQPKTRTAPLLELSGELALYIETERLLGRFELQPEAILVLDATDDARCATLIGSLLEAFDAMPDDGTGRYFETDIGSFRHRFRVLSGWEIPPTVHHVIGAGAVILRYEGSSRG